MEKRLTNEEIMVLLMGDDPLNRAREQFSFAMARIEQAEGQRTPPDVFERRRMEFEAVEKIIDAFNKGQAT
jgi:hypothetical protein